MKCFNTFPRRMRQVEEASDSISMLPKGLSVLFLIAVDSQIAHKLPNFGYPLSMENGMLHNKGRYPLLMKCFKPFLMCIRQAGGALVSICNTHVCLNVSFSTAVTLKLHTKHQIAVPSQYGKLLTALKGDTSIAYEVFQNLS